MAAKPGYRKLSTSNMNDSNRIIRTRKPLTPVPLTPVPLTPVPLTPSYSKLSTRNINYPNYPKIASYRTLSSANMNDPNEINGPPTNNIFMGIGHNGAIFRQPDNQVAKLFFREDYVEKLKEKLKILDNLGIKTGIRIETKRSLRNMYPRKNTNTYKKLKKILRDKRNTSRNNANQNGTYYAITMPNYGTSLDKITYREMMSHDIEQLILSCIQFMKNIKKLQGHHYVHGDLHLGNIILNEKTYQLTMIDFDYLSSYDTFLDNHIINKSIYPPNYFETIRRLWTKKERGIFDNADKTELYNILDYTDTYATGIAFIYLFDTLFPIDTMSQLSTYDRDAIQGMTNTFHNMTESTDPDRIGPDETIKLMEAILVIYNKMRTNHVKKMLLQES